MGLLKRITALSGLILSVSALTMLLGCSRNTEVSRPKLRVGMECSYAPFNWIQPTAKGDAIKISGGWYACGYDVYIAEEIAKILDKDLEIIKVDWDGLLPALTSGKIDSIIAGMSATENRKKAIDFTNDYYTSNVVIVLKKDSKFKDAKSINDFNGAKITGQMGTLLYNFIDQMPGISKEVAMEDFSSIISSLNSGKIDCYISEKPAALTAVHTNPDLTYIEFKEGQGFQFLKEETEIAIGVRKGDPLKTDINRALNEINNEKRNELMDKAVENSCIA